jgi:hypothetical protein
LRRRARHRQRSDLRPIVAGNWRPSTAKVMVANATVEYFMSDMDISILQLTAAGWPSYEPLAISKLRSAPSRPQCRLPAPVHNAACLRPFI